MALFDIGRLCIKIAGRDAGRKCVVVEQLDNTFVLVDGDVRRKKVNLKHLEPLDQILDIKGGASHEQVAQEFQKLGFSVWETKSKSVPERPKRHKKVKEKKAETEKSKKVSKKKETVVKEVKEEKQ